MPIRKPKPTSPGRRFVTYPDFAEITKTEPEKSLIEGLASPAAATPSAARPPAIAAAAPSGLPQDRLQAHQGRRAGQGRRDRVRPEPLRLHRAAALRRRREGLHRRPEPPAGRHDGDLRPAAPTSPSATRCRWPRCRSARWCTTSSSSPAAAPSSARSAGVGIQLMAKEGDDGDAAPALRRDAHGPRSSAARPSAWSATPTTRTSPWARPAASVTWACARRRAARP